MNIPHLSEDDIILQDIIIVHVKRLSYDSVQLCISTYGSLHTQREKTTSGKNGYTGKNQS